MKKRKPAKRKILALFLALLAISLSPSLIGLTRAFISCQPWNATELNEELSNSETKELTKDLPDYRREEEKTFLTLPEWYIVYSTQEYADFISQNSPSNFPYIKSVNQFWQSYVDACNQVSGKYPFNFGHQFTLVFIGLSFSTENMLKGIYENTIGKIYSLLSPNRTEEEIYAASIAREYANFLHQTPWYFFPFKEKLTMSWQETNYFGPNQLRKWERKNLSTLEYGGKALYAGFTNWSAKTTYGGADTEKIYLVARNVAENMKSSDFEVVKQNGELYLIKATRFAYLSERIPSFVKEGLQIEEMAGNDEILITVLGPHNDDLKIDNSEYLFDLPILTNRDKTRIAYKVKLKNLKMFFGSLENKDGFIFEHMYDY